jgi:hypothetical protein
MIRAWARGVAWVAVVAGLCGPPAGAQPIAGSAPAAVLAPPGGWFFAPGFSLAYDSFGQRYAVTDDDTLDIVDEISARMHATLEHRGRTRFRLQNTFGYGQEALRNDLLATFEQPLTPRFELRVQQELRYKGYDQASDDAFANDYVVGTTRAAAIWRWSQAWRLRVDERFEWAWFDSTDRYNYRYRLQDLGGEIERQYGLFSSLRAGYSHGSRAVPDSIEIDYRRHMGLLDWQHDVGRNQFGIQARAERRRYRDPRARSHSWDAGGEVDARLALHPRVRLRPALRGVWTRYDRPDSLWSNAGEHAVEMLVEGDVSPSTVLALGPRGEFRRTGGGIDRAYNQWGLKGSVTLSLGSTLWLQFTEEVGVRSHLAGDDLLYSDFTFNWTTLYLAWQPLPRLGLDLFCSVNPESHADDFDDSTTLLLSTAITYGWR